LSSYIDKIKKRRKRQNSMSNFLRKSITEKIVEKKNNMIVMLLIIHALLKRSLPNFFRKSDIWTILTLYSKNFQTRNFCKNDITREWSRENIFRGLWFLAFSPSEMRFREDVTISDILNMWHCIDFLFSNKKFRLFCCQNENYIKLSVLMNMTV